MAKQAQQGSDPLAHVEQISVQAMGEAVTTLDMLRTQTDKARGLLAAFGFGRRILVPPDEIHVVVGDGRHIFVLSKKSRVFGQTADCPSTYWLNTLTQVIKLKTISFTVTIRGMGGAGVPALDSSKVSFLLWAHAVAKLNPDKAEVASQRVGLDATSLINTITEVGTAELIAAAASMTLEEIIAKRQKLAEIAFPQVNQILSELGYDLALLTITRLDGVAYQKLINQAESRISKETSIATNREQVAELQDDESRQRAEAEIKATTEKKLASERLDAEREVETATLDQQETLAVQRHEVQLRQVTRNKDAAQASHAANLAEVQLTQQLSQAEVEKAAQLARLQSERKAELRAVEQKRTAAINLAQAETEAQRLAVEQARQIERDAERTLAEAKRLEQEELAAAQRAKEIALVESNQLAEAMKVEAEAESRALQIKVDAETKSELVRADATTKADLIRAEAEATATEKRAQAAKIRAEATRAETAAPGLAEAEVETARVEVAEKQVSVVRAEGLAKAEVAQAQGVAEAERIQRLKVVEINAQRELATLYEQAPVLVELEKLRMEFAHQERMSQLEMEAYLKAFEALAPSLQVRLYGNGTQSSRIITDLMALAQGVRHLGAEIPVVGQLLEPKADVFAGVAHLLPKINDLMPALRQVVQEINPRMFSGLKVLDLMDRLTPVVAGQEDLVTALNNIKEDASFRMVGDIPVIQFLQFLGLPLGAGKDTGTVLDELEGDSETDEEAAAFREAGASGEDERQDMDVLTP